MEHLFQLKQRETDIKTEVYAGITNYFSMIYVVGIIVTMMSVIGMQEAASYTSVLLASGVGCIIMGLLANYPVAMAPSLGVTALFSSTLCGKMGYSWQAGLAAIFIVGIIILLIAVTGVRKAIIVAIPSHLKTAISVGIGFFLTFVGLKNCGIIVSDTQNYVALGKIFHTEVLVSLFGIIVLMGMIIRGYKFAILKGMGMTAVLGVIAGFFSDSPALPRIPETVSVFQSSAVHFGGFIGGFGELFSSWNVVIIFLPILFVDFFDTTGTLLAVINRSKLPSRDGEPENMNRALASDAIASILGAVFGATSISSYMESETGIACGGRTGLTAITTGILFLVSILFYPVFSLLTTCVTGPVLVIVGTFMAKQLAYIDWKDYVEAISCFATIIMMILTYSIADGIAFGFIIYGFAALFSKRYREVSPLLWILIGIFCVYFLLI